jgi:hypothetical protein
VANAQRWERRPYRPITAKQHAALETATFRPLVKQVPAAYHRSNNNQHGEDYP